MADARDAIPLPLGPPTFVFWGFLPARRDTCRWSGPERRGGSVSETGVRLLFGTVGCAGDLAVPPGAHGVVLFAHGSGSGRHSPRNRHVASTLQQAGLATLLERRDRKRTRLNSTHVALSR